MQWGSNAMPFNGCFYGRFQTASTSKQLYDRVKRRGRQAGSKEYICVCILWTSFCIGSTPSTPFATLSNKLFSYHLNPNYIIIRKERQSEDSIILTTQLPWKLPSFSFPTTRDNRCVFCYAHFFTPLSFVFTCWPCTKKYNLTSCVFSAKKVSVPGLNVSCTQIKGKKHKS